MSRGLDPRFRGGSGAGERSFGVEVVFEEEQIAIGFCGLWGKQASPSLARSLMLIVCDGRGDKEKKKTAVRAQAGCGH